MSDADEPIKIGELENRPIWKKDVDSQELLEAKEFVELKKLTKQEQTKILHDLGSKHIPESEAARINLIIKLKGGK